MEKKREQELSVLEVLRLHREFHLPHPVPADEQEKPLDKVKEPPRACRSREEKKLLSVVDSIFASGYLTEGGQGIEDTLKTITDAGFTYEIESA